MELGLGPIAGGASDADEAITGSANGGGLDSGEAGSGSAASTASGLFTGGGIVPGTVPAAAVVRSFQLKSYANETWTTSDFVHTDVINDNFSITEQSLWQPFPNSVVSKKGSCFSGEMRRVVQMLGGQADPINYDYTWPTTHGVFVNQITGTRWVIEIAETGVTAWVMPVGIGSTAIMHTIYGDGAAALSYVPLGSEIPSADARRQLCDGDELADAYAGSPLSNEIGWAFSYSGAEAQNVVIKGPYTQGGYDYNKSFRYKITLTADGNGDPLSASLTEEASGWVHSNRLWAVVYYPKWVSCGSGMATARWNMFDAYPDPASSYSTPIYVYYNEDNEEQVFNYEYGETSTEEIAGEFTQCDVTPDANGCLYGLALEEGLLGSYYPDGRAHSITTVSITNTELSATQDYNSTSGRLIEYTWEQRQDGLVARLWSGSETYDIYTKFGISVARTYTNGSLTLYDQIAFIIPWFEREGHFEHSQIGIPYYNFASASIVSSGIGFGDVWINDICTYRMYTDYTDGNKLHVVLATGEDVCASGCVMTGLPVTTAWAWGPYGTAVWHYEGEVHSVCYSSPTPFEPNREIWQWETGHLSGNADEYLTYPSTPDAENEIKEDAEITWMYFGRDPTGWLLDFGTEAANYFYQSIAYSNDGCSFETPWWMEAHIDAFSGNGWVTDDPDAERASADAIKVIGDTGDYKIDALPAPRRHCGWLGCPFPEDV